MRVSLSNEAFLIRGDTYATFNDAGRVLCDRDLLMMEVIGGESISTTSLRSHVGRGSSTHDFVGHFIISLETYSVVTDVNELRDDCAFLSFEETLRGSS